MTLSVISFSAAPSSAFPAVAAISLDYGVLWRVLMPKRAMSYEHILASHVFLLGYRFEMVRIDTASNAAKMVNLIPGWYLSLKNIVGYSVCSGDNHSLICHSSVTISSHTARPQPTTGIRFWRDVRKKSIENANLGFRHVMTLLWSACSGLRDIASVDVARSYFTLSFQANQTKGVSFCR